MSEYDTGNPVPSASIPDAWDNMQSIDRFANSSDETITTRTGKQLDTLHGINVKADSQRTEQQDSFELSQSERASSFEEKTNEFESRFSSQLSTQESTFSESQTDKENRFQQFLLSSGYQFLGDYENGPYVFSELNQYIEYSGNSYRIASASDIGFTTTGTDATSFANDVTHFVLMDGDNLRQDLGSGEGFKYIGQVASYAALKTVIPERSGQRILLASYYANGTTGGGEFVARAGTATDDGGTICVPTGSSTWYWQRVGVVDFDVTWFGAIGDSDTTNSATNTTAIQKAIDAAASAGLANVEFPQTSGFYACGTIYVKPGVSLVSSGRTRGLLGATVYLRAGANAVINQKFKGLWCKQCHFNLWDPDSPNTMVSNVTFDTMLIDGTNLAGAGKVAGDGILIKNTTFDVHLEKTYIWNYLGYGYGIIVDNASTSYLATGVFSTVSQSKIFNCGYGIYVKGAPADSMDVHLVQTLLDHNGSNLYVDASNRAPGMGEVNVYARACRFEWGTNYSIYNYDAYVNFDGWSLAPSSGGQKIFTSSKGKTLINGRLSGVAEGEDASVDGNLVAHPGIISNLTYDKANPVVSLMLDNTTRGSTVKLQALKFKFQFNGVSGFTFQNLVSYVSGNAPRFGIGGLYDTSVSAAVLDTTPVSVGSGNSAISATTQNSGISLIFGGGKKFAFVGMPSINRNTTGTAVNISIQTDNTGTIIGIVFFNAATGAYVNPLSLTGEIQFSFVMFADL